MYNINEIANRIFIARKNSNLKQSDVCKVLGINQSSYSALETGKRDVTVRELFLLSNLFNVPMSWILENNNDNLTENELLMLDIYKKFLITLRK